MGIDPERLGSVYLDSNGYNEPPRNGPGTNKSFTDGSEKVTHPRTAGSKNGERQTPKRKRFVTDTRKTSGDADHYEGTGIRGKNVHDYFRDSVTGSQYSVRRRDSFAKGAND